MSHLKARFVGNQAVRSFLAEVGALYCGYLYNHRAGKGKIAWSAALTFFDESCAYCGTRRDCLPRNTSLTIEHLIENNQFEVGLHHPGNTVPACAACNHSRVAKQTGVGISWQDHLANRCTSLGHKESIQKKRREKIEEYMTSGPCPYPRLSEEEVAFLKKSASELYQEAMVLTVPRVQAYWRIAKMPTPRDA